MLYYLCVRVLSDQIGKMKTSLYLRQLCYFIRLHLMHLIPWKMRLSCLIYINLALVRYTKKKTLYTNSDSCIKLPCGTSPRFSEMWGRFRQFSLFLLHISKIQLLRSRATWGSPQTLHMKTKWIVLGQRQSFWLWTVTITTYQGQVYQIMQP